MAAEDGEKLQQIDTCLVAFLYLRCFKKKGPLNIFFGIQKVGLKYTGNGF